MFRKAAPFELAPVHRALAQGEYETAFAILERATTRRYDAKVQADLRLQLAALYALYGREGLEGGWRCLREARALDPQTVKKPLYRALYWEFCAHRGDPPADVRRGAGAVAGEGMAAFHAASALYLVGANEEALELLENVALVSLPDYLVWRRWSLLGQIHEQLGNWEEAADAFEQSASLSSGVDQQGELLSLAASWLEAGRPHDTLSALANVREELLAHPAERAVRYYLEGRAQLAFDNPHSALELFRQAHELEAEADEVSYSLKLVIGQTHLELGQLGEALVALEEAALLAPPSYRAFILHEYAFALVEAERLEEAREALLAASLEVYPHHAELYADLADVEHRLGHLAAADETARRALDLGAIAPACLILGGLALEDFRFDEAVDWFEQAVSASARGDREWLAAQEGLIDARVQQGYKDPDAIIRYAKAALGYLDADDERRLTLEAYLSEAKARLGGHERLLN
jgi:tetratricopeptide (TPR) repeat protein